MILVKALLTVILPISSITPGAIDANITQKNIDATICKAGYTSTVRPPASYTTKLKAAQLAGVYSIYKDKTLANYEEDHLISLELGGNPKDYKNLWPEPYAGATGAKLKDQIENKLHDLVCARSITLAEAQKAISQNWYAAYLKYIKGSK
jgi:hypothetical protein